MITICTKCINIKSGTVTMYAFLMLSISCISMFIVGCCKPTSGNKPSYNCQPWALRASQCVEDLEKCKRLVLPYLKQKEIHCVDLKSVQERFTASRTTDLINSEVNALLWELWKTTGKPPSLDKASSVRDMLSIVDENIIKYKEYLAKNRHRSEESVQKDGMEAAANLLYNSRYCIEARRYLFEILIPQEERMYSGMDVIKIRIDIPSDIVQAVLSMHGKTPQLFFVFGERQNGDAIEQKKMKTWLAENIDSLKWDENKKIFLTNSGKYIESLPIDD